jgi:hypothetical protein
MLANLDGRRRPDPDAASRKPGALAYLFADVPKGEPPRPLALVHAVPTLLARRCDTRKWRKSTSAAT